MSEPLTRLLAALPPTELDAARSEHIGQRCRNRLMRQTGRASVRRGTDPRRTAQIWQPLVALLGIAYLTDVIVQALRVYGSP